MLPCNGLWRRPVCGRSTGKDSVVLGRFKKRERWVDGKKNGMIKTEADRKPDSENSCCYV